MNAFDKLFAVYSRNRHLQEHNLYAGFSVRRTIIEHTSFCDALRRVTTLHRRGLDAGVPGGLLITGQTGSGKSTLAEFYRAYFPRQDIEDRTVTPVLIVTTPESPSVKSLAEAVLIALGDPVASKGTAEEKTRRIFRYLKECRVELLIIDEFQHFYDSGKKSQAKKVTDWLKNLFNISNIPGVLVGLPRSVMVIRANPQLQRRFSAPFYLKPFGFEGPKERGEFRGVLKKIYEALPLPCPELHEANLSHRFYIASCGLFDYLAKIIDRAVQIAGEEGHTELTQKHFARAFKDEVWRDVPDKLNPFNRKGILRPLTKLGEPFEIWDAPEQYVHKRAA